MLLDMRAITTIFRWGTVYLCCAFGGCCVAIIKDTAIDNFIETVGAAYLEKFSHDASFYVAEIGDGVKEVK